MSKKPSGAKQPKLVDIDYAQAVAAFERAGFVIDRQVGSHIVMEKPGNRLALTVPAHRPIKRGTLMALLKTAGLSRAEFDALLD